MNKLPLYPEHLNPTPHPSDLLVDAELSRDEKRALLASWASDANTVPDCPTKRQLPDGSVVNVGDILRSLRALDQRPPTDAFSRSQRLGAWRSRAGRLWFRNRNRSDDDDDPPPSPAYAALPPKCGGGSAQALPEPVAA